MNKKIMITIDDGSEKGQEINLIDIIGDSIKEFAQETGMPLENGKFNLSALPTKARNAIEEKMEAAKESQKFIKSLLLGELKAISTDGGSFGSAVPNQLYSKIIEKKDALAFIRKYAFSLTQAGTLSLPKDGTVASATWVGAAGQSTANSESNPTLGVNAFVDKYLQGRVQIPYSLLNGSPIALENYVASLIGRAMAQQEEAAFIAGSGATGIPMGIRATAGIPSTAQAGASFNYDDAIELAHGLPLQYRQSDKMVFITSTAGVKLFRKLKDTTGAPIFNPTDNTVFGRPLIESASIPSNLGVGTNETEMFAVDLSYYWIKDGEGLTAKTTDYPRDMIVELVAYQAIDAGLLFTDAAFKLTGVK